MTERLSFFATCAPGLEPVLHEEVRALRLTRSERQTGGVYFEGTFADARRANLWLRTAVRVLMQVARFPSPDGEALYAGARELATAPSMPWPGFTRYSPPKPPPSSEVAARRRSSSSGSRR